MYNQFFQVSGLPFRLTPDRAFFYAVSQHADILKSFRDSRARGPGFRVVTGEIGAGKTMLFRVMRAELEAAGACVAEVVSSNVAPEDLMDVLATQFGIVLSGEGGEDAFGAISDFLAEARAKGRRVVLFVDEAQNMPRASIEALMPLVDLELDGQPAIEVFLLGQPELQRVFDPASDDEASRRAVWQHHLRPLGPEDTRSFILHRLGKAGWRGDPAFTEGALRLIHRQTGGVPRRIIVICNRLLVHAHLEELHILNSASVFEVLQDAESEGLPIGQVLDGDLVRGGEAEGEVVRQPVVAPDAARPFERPRPTPPSPVTDAPEDVVRAAERALGGFDGAEPEPQGPPADLVAAVERALGADGSGASPPLLNQDQAASTPTDRGLGKGADQIPATSTAGARRRPSRAEVLLGHSPPGTAEDVESGVDSDVLPAHVAEGSRAFRSIRLAASLAAGLCVLLLSWPVADPERETAIALAPEGACVGCPTARDAATGSVSEPGGFLAEGPELPEPLLPDDLGAPDGQEELRTTADSPQQEDPGALIDLQALPGQGAFEPAEEAERTTPETVPQDQVLDDELREEVRSVTAEADGLDRSLAELRQSLAELRSQNEILDVLRARIERRVLDGAESAPAANQPASSPETETAAAPEELGFEGLPIELQPLPMRTKGEPSAQTGAVSLLELVLTRNVVDREPSDEVEAFTLSDGSAFAFARVRNVGPPGKVSFVWYRGTETLSIAKLAVGTSGAWRTWSEVDLLPGFWRVEVYSPAQELIGERSFFVTN